MKQKKGISLIVLIVTIIVMIIIAGAIILSLNSTNVIDMASKAIKDYGDKEFEEGLTLIYSDNLIGNYTGKSFNNKKVANDILNMFGYPNIDETTGLVEGGENGKFTAEKYIIESQDGQVKITNPNSKEILLQVLYDKTNKPDFKVVYNNVIYTYDNLNLLSKSEYYKEGVAEDWTYTENTETGTLTLTAFNGEVQADANGLKHLTVPNKLNGKVVSTVRINSTNALKEINGTLTVSPGITVEKIDTTNITKVVLEENIITKHISWTIPAIKGNNITDLIIKSGCNIDKMPVSNALLANVELHGNVILYNRAFWNYHSLTSKSINNILEKATFAGEQIFFQCNFINPIDIEIAEHTNIKVYGSNVFGDCSNINSITIKKGSTITVNDAQDKAFINGGNTQLEKLVIEDNCKIYPLFWNVKELSIDEILIGDNVLLAGTGYSYLFNGAVSDAEVNKLEIGNDFKMQKVAFVNIAALTELKIGDNFINNVDGNSYISEFSGRGFYNMSSLTKIEIGENATINGYLATNCQVLETVIIGENAKFANDKRMGAFTALPSIKYVELGKGAEITDIAFSGCTNLKAITLYLTEEQAKDRSKIPTSWQANVPNATFTIRDENDTEKIIWDVTYTEPVAN